MKASPYLYFSGDCEAALKFYEQATGGKIVFMVTHAETPAAAQTPAEWQQKIIHARIKIGDTLIMAADAPPGHQAKQQGFSVCLNVDTPADADRICAALSEGGTVQMPIGETFFAHRFAMLTDKFGTPWMVLCEKTPG